MDRAGKAKVLDTVAEVLALHKDRYVFPIKLAVTKVSGSGSDMVFMGVLKPVEDNPDIIKVWTLPSGTVLCVDMRFTDWLGLTPTDCVGKHMSALAIEQVRPGTRFLVMQLTQLTHSNTTTDMHWPPPANSVWGLAKT